MKNSTHQLPIIGHIVLLVLLVFALLFYVHRCTHFDNAFYIFRMLHTGDFVIAHDRFIGYATQWLPMIGIKLGAGLKTTMLLYSIGQFLFFAVIYYVIAYVFKNPWAAITMLLALVLLFRYKYFSVISEIQLSVGVLGLWYGWLSSSIYQEKALWLKILGSVLILLLFYAAHPFAFLIAGVLLAAVFLENKEKRSLLIVGGMLAIAFWLKKIGVENNFYEKDRSAEVGNVWQALVNWRSHRYIEMMNHYFEVEYHLLIPFLVAAWLFLIKKKKALLSLGLAITFMSLFVFVYAYHPYLNGESDHFMIDGYMGITGFIAALAITKALFYWNHKKWTIGVLGFLFLFSLIKIENKRHYFDFRHGYHMHLMHSQQIAGKGSKIVVPHQHFSYAKQWHFWTIPLESLMISSLSEEVEPGNIFYNDKDSTFIAPFLVEENQFLSVNQKPTNRTFEEVNAKYFTLSGQPYTQVETPTNIYHWRDAWEKAGKPSWRDFKVAEQLLEVD